MSFDVNNGQSQTPFEEPNTSGEFAHDNSESVPGDTDPLSRMDSIQNGNETPDEPSTTGPLGKRRTGPLRRKRKSGELSIPSMELDNPHPVEEEGWLKSMTGRLLGREEPEVPAEEPLNDDIASRLNRLTGPLGESGAEADGPIVGRNPRKGEDEQAQEESVNWVSPFFGSGTGLTGELTGQSSEGESFSAEIRAESTAEENDAEWQAFLTKLQQTDALNSALAPLSQKDDTDTSADSSAGIYEESEEGVTDLDSFLRLAGLKDDQQTSSDQAGDNQVDYVSWDLSPDAEQLFEPASSGPEGPSSNLPFYDVSQEDIPDTVNDLSKESPSLYDEWSSSTLDSGESQSPFLFDRQDEIDFSNLFKQEGLVADSKPFEDEADTSDFVSPAFVEWADDKDQIDWDAQLPGSVDTMPLSHRIETETPSPDSEEDLRSLFEEPSEEESGEFAREKFIEPELPVFPEEETLPEENGQIEGKKNRKFLFIGVGLAASVMFLSTLALVIFLTVRFNLLPLPFLKPPPKVETPVVSISPVGLELTGGWVFLLKKGELKNGDWVPQGPEWLSGTELRRVVALPMNDQLKAVIDTFKPGDPVRMLMSNNDVLSFRVDQILKVKRNQTDLMAGNSPALIVILYPNNSDDRWVILCK
ncbi:MAG: hypothetical protein LWX83_06025 [Anaerolineae bacterium]|nr:hypothetical protein [Anaerolineae bacterium]